MPEDILSRYDYENTLPPGPVKNWNFSNAKVLDVYDGDTATICVASDEGIVWRLTLRIIGIDTPEIKSSFIESSFLKDAAIKARNRLVSLISIPGFPLSSTISRKDLRKELVNSKHRVSGTVHGTDKYGRWLSSLRCVSTGDDVSRVLIRENLAVKYNGGKRMSESQWRKHL